MLPARLSRRAAEDRYRDSRLPALQRAEEIASAALAPVPVGLNLINLTALQAFQDQWEANPSRRYPWPWPQPQMVADAKKNEPDQFEVSVWSGDTLCGLAFGCTRQAFCRVDYLEGSPDPAHPLKGSVTVIVAGAATAYATALGKDEIRLMNPLPAVVPHYQGLGFTVANLPDGTPCCSWKKVT
jgi:hypothetical protein